MAVFRLCDVLTCDCLCGDLQGCASWKWYFPFHYAPFASDFKDIKGMFTEFEKDTKPVRNVCSLLLSALTEQIVLSSFQPR